MLAVQNIANDSDEGQKKNYETPKVLNSYHRNYGRRQMVRSKALACCLWLMTKVFTCLRKGRVSSNWFYFTFFLCLLHVFHVWPTVTV